MSKKQTPQDRYLAVNKRRRFTLDCLPKTESDIIEKLEQEKSYATYIKKLIRQDIERNN